MSSDTSTLPAWKQALLNRKRHQEDGGPPAAARGDSSRTGTGPGVNTTTADGPPATGSAWKPTTLSKKLQKYVTPSVTPAAEKETTGNRTDSTVNTTSGVPEIQIGSSGSVDDSFVEERLLPIKQNPILLSDRQKRRHLKPNHAKSEKRAVRKSDPHTLTPKSVASDNGILSVSDGSVTPDMSSPAILTEDAGDEVFEEEVTYGKGFVHKLLQKFKNLTGKDEPAPVIAPTKMQGHIRSIGDTPKGSARSSGRSSASEKDPTDKKPSRSTANSIVESSPRNVDEVALCSADVASTGDKTSGEVGSKVESHHRPLSSNDQEQCSSPSIIDMEELPHNIVSTARGIFEHHTSSPISVRKKFAPEKPAPDKPSLRQLAPQRQVVDQTVPDKSNVELPAVNKLTVEQPADNKPSLKRPVSEKPVTEETASSKTFDSWRSNLQNSTTAAKTREDVVTTTPRSGIEPVGKPSPNAPVHRVLYPAVVGSKNRTKVEIESTKDLTQLKPPPLVDVNKNLRNDERDRSDVSEMQSGSLPLSTINSDKAKTIVWNSVGISKLGDEEMKLSEERALSVKAVSKLYEAKTEKTLNSRDLDGQTVERKETKITAKVPEAADNHGIKNTDSGNLSDHRVGVSMIDKEPPVGTKEKTKLVPIPATAAAETQPQNVSRRKVDDNDTMTLSYSKDTMTTQDSTNIKGTTPLEGRVDAVAVTAGNLQPDHALSDQEIKKNTDVDSQVSTTRVRVGSFPITAEQLPQKSSILETAPTVGYVPNSVPSISSIRTDNQVTVIQIGSAVPAKLPAKLENQEVRATIGKADESKSDGGKVIDADHLRNEVNKQSGTSSSFKKGINVQVGYESDRIDTKTETLLGYNGIKGNSRNDTRYETTNDIRNDAGRSDTNRKNLTNTIKSETSSKKEADQKAAGASRPGMLLIRPASNLVASKTKTEYLTMTKYNDIKKGEFAPAKRPIVAEDEMMNGNVVDRGGWKEELFMLRGFEVLGGGVSTGRSMLAKTKQGKKLRINFDDLALQTHEYPSEQSLMAATPAQPGDCDYVDENALKNGTNNDDDDDVTRDDLKSSDLLRSTPALNANGNLSSYVPRLQVDYEFGMLRSEDVAEVVPPGPDPEPKSHAEAAAGLSEPVEEDATWSQTASADLLF